MYNQFPSLAEAFLNYFDVELVNSVSQLDAVGQIRYRVYCEEFGHEPAAAFPDHRESDAYDNYSLHCLITHRHSQRPAACVRLICASGEQSLPIEDHCRESVYLEYLQTLEDDRDRTCEFSRLAVDPAFRRRRGEDHTRLGEYDAMDCSHQEQRTFSTIGIAAFISALVLADLEGRPYIMGMMESNLPRLLRRSGILVQQAGDPMEYHGQRAPYYLTTDLALDNMRDDLHILYDRLYEQLASGFNAASSVSVA